mmetsp:Transcript_22884/g.3765  ORF Transcript_22884/g.3765 Transcript_22884/m.3765 type:complete len:120 (-) Transcript_22884:489-848(-)
MKRKMDQIGKLQSDLTGLKKNLLQLEERGFKINTGKYNRKRKGKKHTRKSNWTIEELMRLLDPAIFAKLREIFLRYTTLISVDNENMEISQYHMLLQDCLQITTKLGIAKGDLLFFHQN